MKGAPCLVLVFGVVLCTTPSYSVGTKPSEPTEGTLTTQKGKEIIHVPLKHTDVQMQISGHLAEVEVTQTFQNPFSEKIEAVYLFPLPTQAAIHELTLLSSDKTIRGKVAEKEEAKQIYYRAKKKGYVAVLLSQNRPNLFTKKVSNIEANAEVTVTVRYTQALLYENGGYEIVFPMVAGPRYIPKNSKTSKEEEIQPEILPEGMRSSHDISLNVSIDAGVPIQNILSTSHQIKTSKEQDSKAKIIIGAKDTIPNKDFILRYQTAGETPQFAVLTHRQEGKEGSFYLMAQPPKEIEAKEIVPRELIFVLDTSSSMRGLPLAKSKEMIRQTLKEMQVDDTFQIVCFDDAAASLGQEMVANKPQNISYAIDWLNSLEAGGGTEMTSGIKTALQFPHDPFRLRIVVFLTDGYIGNEDEIISMVGKHIGDARLFSFGIGSAVNRYLLEEMAIFGRGAAEVIRPDEETNQAIQKFYQRIDRPLLTDISIDWGELSESVQEIVPKKIPDLFFGKPLILSGHYRVPASGTITIHGKVSGKDRSFTVPVDLPASQDNVAVSMVWARKQISELSRQQIRQNSKENREKITEIALRYQILTPYTSFVAVDTSRVTEGKEAKTVKVPVEIPEGVTSYNGYGSGGGSIGYGAVEAGYGSGSYSVAYKSVAKPSLNSPMEEPSPAITRSDIEKTGSNVSSESSVTGKKLLKKTDITSYRAQVEGCLKEPGANGKVTLDISVQEGNVTTVKAKQTGLGNDVARCIETKASGWKFSQDASANKLSVTFDLSKEN